jgi:hypothetical protein
VAKAELIGGPYDGDYAVVRNPLPAELAYLRSDGGSVREVVYRIQKDGQKLLPLVYRYEGEEEK